MSSNVSAIARDGPFIIKVRFSMVTDSSPDLRSFGEFVGRRACLPCRECISGLNHQIVVGAIVIGVPQDYEPFFVIRFCCHWAIHGIFCASDRGAKRVLADPMARPLAS